MDDFNKGFASSTNSIKPPIKGGIKSNNENKLNPELASKLKSPRNKQLPTKNFMNPTISAAIKASSAKKKILGDRNETLDTLEHTTLQRSSSFGSNVVDSDDEHSLQPYDPVKNYLSPRPKFLRYNPDRRRKILNIQENDEDIKISTYFDAGLQLGLGSSVPSDSCSQQEYSAEEAQDENGEEFEDEDDEEEMVEFEEERCCSVKVLFKFLFAVIAVILTTHAICSMKCPSPSQTLDSVWGVNDWHDHVYGLNISEVGYGPVMEPNFMVERLKEGGVYDDNDRQMSETIQEFVEVQNAQTDDHVVHQDEAENDDSTVIQDETVDDLNQDGFNQNAQTDDYVHQDEAENDDSNVIQDEAVDGLVEEDAADANDMEIANDMEDEVEKELDDVKTDDVLIKFTTFDLTIAVLIGHMLLLTSLGAIYVSRCKKVEKEEFKNLEQSTNPQSLNEEEQFVTNEASLPSPPLKNDIIHVHNNIPSVELLGEFVFGEEITSNISTKSSQMEMSTGDSHTVKKQRRKNAEVVTPSPVSVRRSSRLKTRSSVMSP